MNSFFGVLHDLVCAFRLGISMSLTLGIAFGVNSVLDFLDLCGLLSFALSWSLGTTSRCLLGSGGLSDLFLVVLAFFAAAKQCFMYSHSFSTLFPGGRNAFNLSGRG